MSTNPNQYKPYTEYILSLKRPLYDLVKDETDLRLKYLVAVADHPVECLWSIFQSRPFNNLPKYEFKVNQRTYQRFLEITLDKIRAKCVKGINFGRYKKQLNEKNIWNTIKGYWFGVVPDLIAKHLWVPMLKDVAFHYKYVANQWSIHHANVSKLSSVTMNRYLQKKFMTSLLQVKCKLTTFSNPSGSLIQFACWKHSLFQEAINVHFDENNSYTFSKWIPTQKLNIRQIVSKYITPHAQSEHNLYLHVIGITQAQDMQFDKSLSEIRCIVLFDNDDVLTYATISRNDDNNVNNDKKDNLPPPILLPPLLQINKPDLQKANRLQNSSNNNRVLSYAKRVHPPNHMQNAYRAYHTPSSSQLVHATTDIHSSPITANNTVRMPQYVCSCYNYCKYTVNYPRCNCRQCINICGTNTINNSPNRNHFYYQNTNREAPDFM